MKVLDVLSGPLADILDKFVSDKDLKTKLNHELELELHRANIAQLEINKVEAAHKSVFVSGWRPACAWMCTAALGYHFILQPIIVFLFALSGETIPLPEFDMNALLTILLGMLGLGGMRSFEKMKGVNRDS